MRRLHGNAALTFAALCFCISSSAWAADLPLRALELQEKKAPQIYESEVFDQLRPNAIKEAAQTLAIQEAVKYRYANIVSQLNAVDQKLDQVFNFHALLLNDNKVVPPVIGETNSGFVVESDILAKSTEVAYRIISPARLTATPPNWRDYLIQAFSVVDNVNPSLLPENTAERQIWKEGIETGWEMGLAQADRVYTSSLNRLVRDFKGMLRFNLLAAQDMVSIPILAEGRLGVQVGEKILDVDQKIFRITSPTYFRSVKEWKPILASPK